MDRGQYPQAQRFFERALASTRVGSDRFLEATALLNLSWSADEQTHFDEALDWANAAREISVPQDFARFWITSGWPTIRTESSHLAVNRGILTHPWGKKSRTSEFRRVFRCGSVATQKCNGNYQYKDQQTQQTKFNHRRVENGA